MQHALDTCAEDIARKKLRLKMSLDANKDAVFADPARLQPVFWNLLKNAVKFAPENGEIRIFTRNDEGDFVVEISDSGVGISPEAIPKIFTAFEQGDGHANPGFGGLGLGLAISHALVQAHHGRLRASSPGAGQGATFFVTLPTEVSSSQSAPPREIEKPGPTATPDAHRAAGKCAVLLIEDHADSATVLARILRHSGYDVSIATNVAEALQIFEHQEIHAIVSDIGLPDGDGYTLLERLRKIRNVPGIALSGFGMERDLARSEAAGFAAHLTKPVNASELKEALAKAIAK